MKAFLGIVLIIAGAALAAYVGVWLCLIGGIVQVIEGIKANPVDAMDIAIGVARFLCTGLAGGLTALVAIFPGYAMLTSS